MNTYFFRVTGLVTSLSLFVINLASAQSPVPKRSAPTSSSNVTFSYASSRSFPHPLTPMLAGRGQLNRSGLSALAPIKKTAPPLPSPSSQAGAISKTPKRDTLPVSVVSPVVDTNAATGAPAQTATPGKRLIKAQQPTDTKRSAAVTHSKAADMQRERSSLSPGPVIEYDEQVVPDSQIDNTPLTDMHIVSNNAHALRVPAIPIRDYNVVKSYYTELPYNKTISIIFPTPIKSVDLGSRDIIADKASDVENVLKVKASKVGFNETNFSVITTDGKFWSFVANYNEQPSLLALNLAMNTMASESPARMGGSREDSEEFINGLNAKDGVIQFSGIRASASEVVYNCNQVNNKRRTIRHLGVTENLMEATIRGFYVKDNVMYVKLQLKNNSNISYDIDYMRFFIVDKAVAKRTTFQETEIVPFYVHNEGIKTIPGHKKMEQVLAFQKFTIPDNKRILVQINEAGGGRALTFVMNNEDIMNSGKL